MVIFNEANVVNILETCLFAASACQALDDSVIDLLDYALRHLNLLCSGEINSTHFLGHDQGLDKDTIDKWTMESVLDELKRLRHEVTFQIAIKCISIVRYLTDHVELLPLGALTRMTVNNDLPIMLCQLLESKPWLEHPGRARFFDGTAWTEYLDQDLPKIEAQVWIALYNLLSKKVCSEKYQLHHYRLNILCKMAGEINDWTIRQLPILEKLKEWLLRLSVVKPQAEAAKDLIMIESVAEIRTALEERYAKRYEDIAQDQV